MWTGVSGIGPGLFLRTRVEIQNSRIRKHLKKGPRLVKVLFATPGWWFDPCSSGKKWGEIQMGGKSMDLLRQGVSRTGSQLVVSTLPSWQEGKTGEISAPEKLLFLCLSENLKVNTRMLVGSQPNLHCVDFCLPFFPSSVWTNTWERLGILQPVSGKSRHPVPRPPSVYGFKSHCDFFLCTHCSTVWGHKFQCSSVHMLPLQTASIIFEGRSVPCMLEMPTPYIVRTHNRPSNCWVSQRSPRGNSVVPNIC